MRHSATIFIFLPSRRRAAPQIQLLLGPCARQSPCHPTVRGLKIRPAPCGPGAVRRAALRPRQRAPCPSLCPTSPPRPVAREHPQPDLPRALFAPLPPHAVPPLSDGRHGRGPPRADARRPPVRFVAGRRHKFGGASEARRRALLRTAPRANPCPPAHSRDTHRFTGSTRAYPSAPRRHGRGGPRQHP